MTDQLQALDQIRSTVLDLAIKFGPRLFVALVTLAVGAFVGKWLGTMTDRLLERLALDPPVRGLLARIVRIAVLALFLILALQNLGVELLPLIAGLGVAGAGVALAMQGVLGNVVAGLTIIFTRPFRVGEYISIIGVEGRVLNVTLFNTTLGHPDRSTVVIPNRKIVGEVLHNYGEIRQLQLAVGVAYDTDLALARTAIDDVLSANPRVLRDPEPVVHLAELADSSVNFRIRPWVAVSDFGAARSELNAAILETFRARGIVIPFPQRDVHLVRDAA